MHAPVSGRSGTLLWRFALLAFLPLPLLVGCNKNPTTQGDSAPEGGTIEGHLEVVTAEEIAGWVWNSSQPDAPLKVDIFDGDKKVATVVADVFRQDLVDAKIGNGKHGFSHPTPDSLKDGKSHTVKAKASGTDHELTGSSMTLKAP